jgi:hypothetical protein
VRAPAGVSESDLLSGGPEKPVGRPRAGLFIALGVLVVVLAAAAYWFFRPKPPPPKPAVAPKPAAAVAKPAAPAPAAPASSAPAPAKPTGPTPSATLNEIAAAPGNAVAKAQGAVTARRTNEQVRVDALAEGNEPPEARALNTPPPSRLTAKPGTPATPPVQKSVSTAQVAPGVTATTITNDIAGVGSAAFQSWVGNVRINGVFQGSPARALINGRTVRVGQTVDDALGIVFYKVDAENRMIVFRDATGATISRRY